MMDTEQAFLRCGSYGRLAARERKSCNKKQAVLGKLQDKFQGKTPRQKNPYAVNSMAWAAWTIARLGGWTGYPSEAKPDPITMLHGLQRLDGMVQGWKLAKMWACDQ